MAGLALFTVASLVNGVATSSGMLIAGRAAAGPRRRARLAGRALDRDDDLRRGPRAHEGARHLERDRRRRRRGRPDARRPAHRHALVALGLLHQPADRDRRLRCSPRATSRTRAPRSGRRPSTSPARRPSPPGCSCSSTTSSRRSSTAGRPAGRSACSCVAAALLAAFVVIERRSKAPLIRLGIFRLRSLTSANVAMLFVISGLFGMFYFASIYVQEILGYSPLKAGVAFVPVTFGIVIGAGARAAADPARSAPRAVPVVGIALAAIGLVLLSRHPDARHATWPTCFPGLVMMSIGMGLTFVPVTLIATTEHRAGRRRARVGPLQHVAAGRRRARARDPLVDRREPGRAGAHERDARRGARRRLPARVPRRRRADARARRA